MAWKNSSLRMRFLNALAGPVMRKNARPLSQIRADLLARDYPDGAAPTSAIRHLCHVQERFYDGRHTVYNLSPRENASGVHILYIHGGAYYLQAIKPHWWGLRQLIRQTGAGVTFPVYPLTPEYSHETAFAMVENLYDALVEEHGAKRVVIAGDSAGGGIALALAQGLIEKGKPTPAGLLLFAPWLDATISQPESVAIDPKDHLLRIDTLQMAGQMWAGKKSPDDPLISPYFGAPEGLPPMEIFHGSNDVLMPASRDYAARATRAGVEVNYHLYPGAFHAFNMVPITPEAKDANQKAAAFVNRFRP